MKKITINASRKYDVIMEKNSLEKAGEYICQALGAGANATDGIRADHKRVCIVTDTTVDKLYGQQNQALWKSLENSSFDVYKYVFPGGENHKTLDTISGILEFLAENNFTRSDILLALGGGIVGDVTGFAAATFLRGIEFIQIPTTFLAIVDSSVGGKTGVNLSSGKNLAGAFWQPGLVLFDPNVLETLNRELKLDGVAEAIKAGFIADGNILTLIDEQSDLSDHSFLTELAAMAIDVKRQIVEDDEREGGKRQLLNLGHTAAHAIEKCSCYEISHGHAVAMGMAIISAAAEKLSLCDEGTHTQMMAALNKFNFPLDVPYSASDLTSAALHDKKRRGDEITLVIPKAPGDSYLKKLPVDQLQEFFALGLER